MKRKFAVLFVLLLVLGTMPVALSADEASHQARLKELDPVFRQGLDYEAWLGKAGVTWTGLSARSEQIVEETFDGQQWASGMPVDASGLSVPYPNGMTTNLDRPVEGRCIDVGPDSKLCTDVVDFRGKCTVYVSVLNWGQFTPEGTDTADVYPPTVTPVPAKPTEAEPTATAVRPKPTTEPEPTATKVTASATVAPTPWYMQVTDVPLWVFLVTGGMFLLRLGYLARDRNLFGEATEPPTEPPPADE